MNTDIELLPLKLDDFSPELTKQLISSHKALAFLHGASKVIPNESILINTLSLQEAKDSSEIENIITTHDELYKSQLFDDYYNNVSAKEVSRYAAALKAGFESIKTNKLLLSSTILNIQEILENNDAGYRKLPGTNLINEMTKEIIFTPPQDINTISILMNNLVQFINDNDMSDLDPLIKMAIIHHRFETIHPFYDGNGRTGRIINILYLVKENLLSLPILYLSRYIIQHKSDYYNLLQQVRNNHNWEPWLMFMLKAIEQTSNQAIELIDSIKDIMHDYKMRIRKELPKIYSQDLLNNLFKHPYTKIEFIMNDLNIHRKTASKYLDTLAQHNFLTKLKIGKFNYYINTPLYNLFKDGIKPDINTTLISTVTI